MLGFLQVRVHNMQQSFQRTRDITLVVALLIRLQIHVECCVSCMLLHSPMQRSCTAFDVWVPCSDLLSDQYSACIAFV